MNVARLFDEDGYVLLSPSGMKKAANCWRDWNETYPRNNRDLTPKRGTIFGKMVHARVEAYAKGRTLYHPEFGEEDLGEFQRGRDAGLKVDEYLDESLPVAQSMLPYLPETTAAAEVESPCTYPVHSIYGRSWRINPESRKDLVAVGTSGCLELIDIKTTAGGLPEGGGKRDPWLYVPTIDVLRKDPQVIIYSLDVMLNYSQDYVDCCWLYGVTRGQSQSKPVRFRITEEHAIREFERRWLPLGDAMARVIKLAHVHGPALSDAMPAPEILMPFEDSPCSAYNICNRHQFKGGDCNPGHSMGVLSDYLNRKKRKRSK